MAYDLKNGPIQAVLSVAVVRLGQMGGFQDRLNRPLWHLSVREFVLNMRSLRRHGRCAKPWSAGVVYRIALDVDAVVWQTALEPLRVVEDGHLTRQR